MSDQPSFFEKLSHFLRGKPTPTTADAGLSTNSPTDQKLGAVLAAGQPPTKRISDAYAENQSDGILANTSTSLSLSDLSNDLADLSNQVRKLGKTQFKTNTLYESQLAQQNSTLESLQTALNQQDKRWIDYAKQQEQAIEAAQLELLGAFLPVLDGLDAAFYSGVRQVLKLPMQPAVRQATIAWLDGVRLARIRFLDILAAHNVKPIPTLNQPFDPHRHIAVATDASGQAPDGTIVGQDRAGYETADKVLRFAEVVVARSANQHPQSMRQDGHHYE